MPPLAPKIKTGVTNYMTDHFDGDETNTSFYTAAIRVWLQEKYHTPPLSYDHRALKDHITNCITSELRARTKKTKVPVKIKASGSQINKKSKDI